MIEHAAMMPAVALFLFGALFFASLILTASFGIACWELHDRLDEPKSRQTYWLSVGLAINHSVFAYAFGALTYLVLAFPQTPPIILTPMRLGVLAAVLLGKCILVHALASTYVDRKIRWPWWTFWVFCACWGLLVGLLYPPGR